MDRQQYHSRQPFSQTQRESCWEGDRQLFTNEMCCEDDQDLYSETPGATAGQRERETGRERKHVEKEADRQSDRQ